MASPTPISPTISYEEKNKLYARIVARVWTDPEFAEQFFADPKGVLQRQYGFVTPKNQRIVALQNTSSTFNLVMQTPPIGIEGPITGAGIAQAGCFGSVGSLGTAGTWCGTAGTAGSLGTSGSWDL